jgi:UDP-GlcNAc:undecaprenyl-phosphate GlcNAc-1-phosphate transferase
MTFIQSFVPLSPLALTSHLLFGAGLVLVSLFITRLMLHRFRIMDTPNDRSSHTEPVPKAGGLAVVATFLLGIMAIYLLGDKTPISQGYFSGFVLSALAIAVVSFYDDINYKSFTVKLGTQVLAACVMIAFGVVIDQIGLPRVGLVQLGWLAYPVTFLWIVGLTNSFNFMDGLDGMAAGVAVIVSFFFGLITLSQGSTFVYITCYTVLAGSLGFLYYNFPPARIFMGDVGSAFLGFIFATLAIIAARYDHSHTSFFVMPLLLFNFIFDTGFTFVRRLLNREYVTQAHRTHLYQLCNRLGCSHRTVSLSYYAMCVAQGLGAICMVRITGDQRVLVFIPYLLFQIVFAAIVLKKSKQAGLL